jgi:hypothetical protein
MRSRSAARLIRRRFLFIERIIEEYDHAGAGMTDPVSALGS